MKKYRVARKRSLFGALDVPSGMKTVSEYRASANNIRPFTIMPFGPPGRWLERGPEAPSSSAAPGFGRRRTARKSTRKVTKRTRKSTRKSTRKVSQYGRHRPARKSTRKVTKRTRKVSQYGRRRPARKSTRKNTRRTTRTRRTRFGNSLADKYVNPSGYLSTWYGAPKIIPTSWNPLLLQGQNVFREGINNPLLSQVMPASGAYSNTSGTYGQAYGRRRSTRKTARKSTRKTSRKSTRKTSRKSTRKTSRKTTRRTRRKHDSDSEDENGFGRFRMSFGKGRRAHALFPNALKSKGWSKVSKRLDRHSLPAGCFLQPGKKLYPYCNNDERVDCRGLLAAKQRAGILRKRSLVSKATKLGKKYGCSWAL